MARRAIRTPNKPTGPSSVERAPAGAGIAMLQAVPAEGMTGRYLVLMQPDDMQAGRKALSDRAGFTLASMGDFAANPEAALQIQTSEGLVFEDLGIAVLNAPPDQVGAMGLAVAAADSLKLVEPERVVYAIGEVDFAYLRGYRDAVNHLVDHLMAGEEDVAAVAAAFDEITYSWALQATGVDHTRLSGNGIKVAILDTGLDMLHPDFVGRAITSRSFVEGVLDAQDGHGHGTHCAGLACGSERPGRAPRYGIAHGAEIFIGKVLNDAGRGADGSILAGLQWAISNACDLISMSLGSPTVIGSGHSKIFEQAAQRALERGSLIVAAAGNDSRRPGLVSPVSHPANCPSIVAVGAVDRSLRPAWFSNGGLDRDGGQVDIAAPGVAVASAWPSPTLYKEEDGTSMATPIVAGIAALFAEANPNARGRLLLADLLQGARRTSLSASDVGMGIVQVPRP